MKKFTITLGIILLAALVAVPLFGWAQGGSRDDRGGGDYRGPGDGHCGWDEGGQTSLTEDQRQKLADLDKKFAGDVKELRESIWSKSEELNKILDAANPDATKAQAVQKEISDLQAVLSDKLLNRTIEARKIAPDLSYGYGRGYGMGYGPMMGPDGGGYGRMGYGMGSGHMTGPGRMMGPGMMGPGGWGYDRDYK